jgi:hypothetical protein
MLFYFSRSALTPVEAFVSPLIVTLPPPLQIPESQPIPPYTSAGTSAEKNEEDHQLVRINQTTKNALIPQFCNDKCQIKLRT